MVLAISGFGCTPGRRSHKIYCQSLCDGEKFYIRGHDVLGILSRKCVPEWASNKANLIRQVVQKERKTKQTPTHER